MQGELLQDGHTEASWIGFGGDGNASGGNPDSLTQAGIALTNHGKYGGQGTINAITDYCVSDGNCQNFATIDDFSVSSGNKLDTTLTFEGNTAGLGTYYGDEPPGVAKFQDTNLSGAFWDNETTGKLTSSYFANQQQWVDYTVEWEFEDTAWNAGPPYNLAECGPGHNLECAYLSERFANNVATRLNSTSSYLIDLQYWSDYISASTSQIWVCPSTIQSGYGWDTEDGYGGTGCD